MNGTEVALPAAVRAATGEPDGTARSRRPAGDAVFRTAAVLAAFLAAASLFATVIAITYDSRTAIKAFGIWGFLSSTAWNPVTQRFGALAFIAGTLISSTIAMTLAVPVSFGVAVFIAEIGLAPEPGRRGDRAVGGHPQHRVRPLGSVGLRPGIREPGALDQRPSWCDPGSRAPLPRAAGGNRHAHRRHRPRGHGLALHLVDHAGRVP
jgi:hypothetical protein